MATRNAADWAPTHRYEFDGCGYGAGYELLMLVPGETVSNAYTLDEWVRGETIPPLHRDSSGWRYGSATVPSRRIVAL